MYEIQHYLTDNDKNIFLNWFRNLKNIKAKIAIDKRLDRLMLGNFGDRKFCRNGVFELRIDIGAGYRVYYAISGKQIVLLLCGGDKNTQNKDIELACTYWQDFQNRIKQEG